jgi:hypothetical protein
MEPKRITRSRTERMLGGVCGGLAEYFDADETSVAPQAEMPRTEQDEEGTPA